MVFTDHACDDGLSPDRSREGEFGCIASAPGLRICGSLLSGLAGTLAVVVDRVLAEHLSQVPFAENEDPVQQFTAERSDHSFAVGVHRRRSRPRCDDPQAFSFEHLTECSNEERDRDRG